MEMREVKHILIAGCTCILLGLLFHAQNVAAQSAPKPTINIKELFTIGGQKNATKPYIFFEPSFVSTDKDQNIYVADWKFREIRVYNSDGKYVRSIGRSGKGPGEFTEVSGMLVNNKNQILGIDRYQMRFTLFDTNGNVLDTKYFPKHKRFSPWEIRQAPDGKYFMLYYDYEKPHKDYKRYGNLIHVMNSSLDNIVGSLFSVDLDGDLNNPFINYLVGGPDTGYFTIDSDSVLYAVPFLYTGIFYKFHRSKNDQWSMETRFNGKVFYDKTFTVVNPDKYKNLKSFSDVPPGLIIGGSQTGTHAGFIHNEADGIFTYKQKYILVFTNLRHGAGREQGIELFNPSGHYVGYYSLSNFKQRNNIVTRYPIKPSWIRGNRIYFIDQNDGFARIVVANIEIRNKE